MANISISSPFLRAFTHADTTAGVAAAELLAAAATPERRIIVIVQNKSTSASIQVILAATGSVGIYVPPLGNISLDNYNGAIRVIASAAATSVHIAYAVV
jgi:uncharacterized protein (DUF111 family)